MKKSQIIIVILFTSSLVLGACSNEEGNTNDEANILNESNNIDEKDDDMSLGIGDTGISNSNLGKAEITLDSAEMAEEDDLQEDGKYAPLIVVHLKVKNIGDESFDPEEVLSSGVLVGSEEEYGSKWMYYEVSEEWKNTLNPDEETSGIIVFSHAIEDEYELIFGDIRSGSNNAESSNKISFEFSNEEVN
ncbi:DUF4352 domain-containing protein [Oceanobacillus jeddahense]|uniref:DUF4352 domain-containing protein n=1 Tax=Oceanobacillus jeddahense TaxID=1462527 RepID=A0ABY5K1H9_9BACI|nr:DUF4352 domain-containing protein [Oceanobacillus jeddahense]UUI05213.1 DUF4352 domain-containing protein [Oceanobacillus jeddahense]